MRTMYLDIETLPAASEFESVIKEQYEKIPDRPGTFEEYYRRTALSGNFGQILCIGYAIDEGPVDILTGDEKGQLLRFWELAKSADRFVGHNIIEFDMSFIMKRSIIYRIRPTRDLSFARYRSDPMYDTQKEWDNWASGPNGRGSSLDTLAKIFGYQSSKQGIDGSQVYDFWQAGRQTEIYEYCKRDVELTRKVYHRMTFVPDALPAGGEQPRLL